MLTKVQTKDKDGDLACLLPKVKRLMDCMQKANKCHLWQNYSYFGSTETAKMRGYQVTVHTDPEVSHSLGETGKEHGKEAFEMILYLK